MRKIIVFAVSLLLVSIIVPSISYAQATPFQRIGSYYVSIAQDPLSPFVGEEVEVAFDFEQVPAGLSDLKKPRKPAEGVKGKIIIKETTVKKYVGKDTEVEEKVIYEENKQTDVGGSVGAAYTFKKEGLYNVSYVWGINPETESISRQVHAREPSSYFLAEELNKRIFLFVGIAFGGMIVGGIMTFILLTSTLHPKR